MTKDVLFKNWSNRVVAYIPNKFEGEVVLGEQFFLSVRDKGDKVLDDLIKGVGGFSFLNRVENVARNPKSSLIPR